LPYPVWTDLANLMLDDVCRADGLRPF